MRKGRIKYYFKNKKVVINDVGKLCDMNEQLEKELERYKNIIDELEEELERETNIKEEDTCLEHNTYIDINQTLKKVLNRLKELKGSDE